jgi:hypothetical protein
MPLPKTLRIDRPRAGAPSSEPYSRPIRINGWPGHLIGWKLSEAHRTGPPAADAVPIMPGVYVALRID